MAQNQFVVLTTKQALQAVTLLDKLGALLVGGAPSEGEDATAVAAKPRKKRASKKAEKAAD